MRSLVDRPTTQPQLRECPSCGLLQTVPALMPGITAHCVRCPTTLRRTSSHRIDHIIALAMAAFVLLVVMCTTTLMSVETAGIKRTANLFSGPQELVRQNMAALGAVVVFVTVLAPLGRLVGTLYVLIRLHEMRPPRHLQRVFALAERLRPWSMIEVFVFGVFVAYVKLGDLVTIGLLTGVYALLALTFVLVWMDSALDREAVWERLDRRNLSGGSQGLEGAIGCETCGLVSAPEPAVAAGASMDELLAALRAAAESTRLRLLVLCARGELTVSELAQILGQMPGQGAAAPDHAPRSGHDHRRRLMTRSRRVVAIALPAWGKPQLTRLVDPPPEGPDWLHEIKFDGYRMHARLERGVVRLLTRTGLDWTPKYPAIAAALSSFSCSISSTSMAKRSPRYRLRSGQNVFAP